MHCEFTVLLVNLQCHLYRKQLWWSGISCRHLVSAVLVYTSWRCVHVCTDLQKCLDCHLHCSILDQALQKVAPHSFIFFSKSWLIYFFPFLLTCSPNKTFCCFVSNAGTTGLMLICHFVSSPTLLKRCGIYELVWFALFSIYMSHSPCVSPKSHYCQKWHQQLYLIQRYIESSRCLFHCSCNSQHNRWLTVT